MSRYRSVGPPTKTLTDQQKYLLQRLPGAYDLNGYHRPIVPVAIKRAQKIVDRWEKQQSLAQCKAKKRAEALPEKAKEVIYFGSDQKALAVVRQVEKLLKQCGE